MSRSGPIMRIMVNGKWLPLWETVCIVRVTSFLPLVGGSACASRPLCRPPRGGTTLNFMGQVDRKRRVLTVKDRATVGVSRKYMEKGTT